MREAFNFTTNTYTCKEAGTYAVFATLRSTEGHFATSDILLDDQLVVTVISTDVPSVQTAAMVIIPCSSGGEIKLAGKFIEDYEIIGGESSRTSTLTAFLIGKLVQAE